MTGRSILERLRDPRPLLLDAAMGTALLERGLELRREDAIGWAVARPEEVLSVQRSHVAAGAELVLADTFGARPPSAVELTAAAAIAKESGAAWVALPLWPGLGGRAFAQAVRSAAAAGADLLWLETGMRLADVERSLRIARDESGLPVAVTLALAAFPSQLQITEELQAAEVVEVLGRLAAQGASIVGLNCGPWGLEREHASTKTLASHGCAALVPDHRPLARPLDLPGLARALSSALPVPIALKPDAGGRTPEAWAELLGRCAGAGASLVGGCCGTDARHLRQLAARLGRTAS